MSEINKLKIGMVGLGFGKHMIEEHILSGEGSKYFELEAICDLNENLLDECLKKYGVKSYNNIDMLLKDENIDAIGLFTGPNNRAELIKKIIKAKKDVMTTKPFEIDHKKAREVLIEAKNLNRVVFLNSPCATLSEDFKIIKKWQTEYDLGRIIFAKHECWYKSVEKQDGSWYDDKEKCPVAPIFRLGIYGINDMVRLIGEAESVQVMESRIFTKRPTPDIAQLNIKFKNGAMANLVDSWCLQPARGADSLIIYFENGTIYRNPILQKRKNDDEFLLVLSKAGEKDSAITKKVSLLNNQNSLSYQWENFYKAIKGELVDNEGAIDDIVNGIKVIEAMKKASRSGMVEYL